MMRKRILSLFLVLTLCLGMVAPAFAAGTTLDGAVSVSAVGEGTSNGTYNGRDVMIDWYPAGTVFTHVESYPYAQTNIYMYEDGAKMATSVTILFAGGEGFTLPADGVVYELDLVNMEGGADKHYYICASGANAPAATEKPVVKEEPAKVETPAAAEKPAGDEVSLPKIAGLPKTTLALTNVVDTYNISLVAMAGISDNGPIEVEKTVPVYRLAESGSALKYALEDANAFIYPSITDFLMVLDGTYKYTGEGYGQLTHMSSPSTGEYELAKKDVPTDCIYEMKIMDEVDGEDLVFYYTYADLSAYAVKGNQPAPVEPAEPETPAETEEPAETETPSAPAASTVTVTIGADSMVVNDKVIKLDVAPFITNGRTMLQYNVLDAFGVNVRWVGETRSVIAEGDGIKVVMTLDSKVATINGEEVTLDVAPYAVKGRTIVPVGLITGVFGLDYDFTHNADGTIASINFTSAK